MREAPFFYEKWGWETMDLIAQLANLEAEGLQALAAANDLNNLIEVEGKYLSKKGLLSALLKSLKDVPADQRPQVGARANEAKAALEKVFTERKSKFDAEALELKLQKERIDWSLPARKVSIGSTHPITKVIAEISQIFGRLGFDLTQGPEVETEFYNFEALNIAEDHPARDMQDTFYLPWGSLLRTQTSPVQIRTMKSRKPPIRILSPGAVFRSDYDVTHTPMFHQVEGLYVDQGVSFAELKGCLEFFAREMFGQGTKIRLRPSYFPFVEPGAEVDVTCAQCKGKGCRVCKETGWLEILGAGMVHPKVFEAVGYDPTSVSGFAFGMGVERIAMLKYSIPDLRLLFENDPRFLKQFGALT